MTLKNFMRGRLGKRRFGAGWSRKAFTLIELLAVIAIIGLLAGLVVGLSGLATAKSREARMRGEHAKLLTNIEGYKAELGHYPPDNGRITQVAATNRVEYAGKNPLFYELSGATFENTDGGQFTTLNKSEVVRAAHLKTAFEVNGIDNSARQKGDVAYRQATFRPNQYSELDIGAGESADVEVLVVPINGPHQFFKKQVKAGAPVQYLNPWFYDSSSTNRHNLESFDLWSEYLVGKDTKVIANWKD